MGLVEFDPQLQAEEPDSAPETTRGRDRRFYTALACYAAFAILASFTLDGKFLWVVWIFLAGLALKTFITTLQKP